MTGTATTTTATTSGKAMPGMAMLLLQQITAPQATATIIPTTSTATTMTTTTGGGIGTGTGTTNDAPLFEVKLELTETEIRFSPAFDASVENNFQQIVEQLLLDIKQTCDCMPRIVSENAHSDDENEDVVKEEKEKEFKLNSAAAQTINILAMAKAKASASSSSPVGNTKVDDLEMLRGAICDALAHTVEAALNYAAKFHAYEFLWIQQSADVLASCMQTAREQTTHISGCGYAIMETFKKEQQSPKHKGATAAA